MTFIGIDIGSTSAKAVVLDEKGELLCKLLRPTGWSSREAADLIRSGLEPEGFDVDISPCTATGYGRLNVPYAWKTATEITCHAKGAAYLFGMGTFTVIDIGGQDTKVISVSNGKVTDFVMNDKCSAGTGRFVEVMANSLSVGPDELFELAQQGSGVTISSLCTVFAESEVVGLIGGGAKKEDIAYGIVESVADKVAAQYGRLNAEGACYLTGGLCECPYITDALSRKLGSTVTTHPLGRYAGAIGGAIVASEKQIVTDAS